MEIEAKPHSAEGDVLVLSKLFEILLKELSEKTGSRESAIEKMIDISSKPFLYKIFNFGKYKGQMVSEVLLKDRKYLDWLLTQKIQNSNYDEDWIYTLKTHLAIK